MAAKMLVSFSLVFLAAALFAGHAQGTGICDKADYVPLCRSVVKGASDPTAAIKIAIEHLLFETKRVKTSSVRLGNKQAISTCSQNYDSAIDDLEKSLEYLKSNDKQSLQVMLSGTISFYNSCSDALAEISTFGSVKLATNFVQSDTTLQHLAGNCLYFATLLK